MALLRIRHTWYRVYAGCTVSARRSSFLQRGADRECTSYPLYSRVRARTASASVQERAWHFIRTCARVCARAHGDVGMSCRVASRRCRWCVIVARTSQLFFNYPPTDRHLRTVNVNDRQFITVNCTYSSLSWLLNFSHWAISIDLLRIVFPFCIVINLNVSGCNNFSIKIFLWIYLQVVDAICCILR